MESRPTERVWREAAIRFGIAAAKKQFDGRTGHGESSRVIYRQLDEKTLAALLGAAFEAGAEHAAARAKAAPETIASASKAVAGERAD